jgi:murein DD-endopeptidase MepM/ murein hydrolase activator NlpD
MSGTGHTSPEGLGGSFTIHPPRTPGTLGHDDAADPDAPADLGDTPGSTGVNDGAQEGAEDPARFRQSHSHVVSPIGCSGAPSIPLLHFPVKYESGFSDSRVRTGVERATVVHPRRRRRPRPEYFWIYFDNSMANPRGTTSGTRPHDGIDIIGPLRSIIKATTSGTVVGEWTYRKRDGTLGTYPSGVGQNTRGAYFIRLIDDDGYMHYYAHLYDDPRTGTAGIPPLVAGARVNAGDYLGRLGATGTGIAHLHYQVRRPRPEPSGTRTTTPVAGGPSYSNSGGASYNPYCELVRLAVDHHRSQPSHVNGERFLIPPFGRSFPSPTY